MSVIPGKVEARCWKERYELYFPRNPNSMFSSFIATPTQQDMKNDPGRSQRRRETRNWKSIGLPSFPSERRKHGFFWMRLRFAELPEIREEGSRWTCRDHRESRMYPIRRQFWNLLSFLPAATRDIDSRSSERSSDSIVGYCWNSCRWAAFWMRYPPGCDSSRRCRSSFPDRLPHSTPLRFAVSDVCPCFGMSSASGLRALGNIACSSSITT